MIFQQFLVTKTLLSHTFHNINMVKVSIVKRSMCATNQLWFKCFKFCGLIDKRTVLLMSFLNVISTLLMNYIKQKSNLSTVTLNVTTEGWFLRPGTR